MGMPSSPVQFAPSVRKRCDVADEPHYRRPFRRHGVARVQRAEQQEVGDDRERERQHDADGERRLEVALEAVEQQLPEPALADERGDGDEADGGDGGDADAGDDRGHRERELDAQQLPRLRVPHARCAASFTSGGTPSRPVTVFRTRMSSVYAVSGISAVVRLRKPVIGTEEREQRERRDRVDDPGDRERSASVRAAGSAC